MTTPSLQDRMDENGIKLPEKDMPAFAEMVADVDRMSAWVRAFELSYADELAVNFVAPKP
jgi:hypothetical protein